MYLGSVNTAKEMGFDEDVERFYPMLGRLSKPRPDRVNSDTFTEMLALRMASIGRGISGRLAMSEDPQVLDEDEVRVRAHEISLGPDAGSPEENWLRAVDELRHERVLAEDKPRPPAEPESPFPPNTASLTHP